MNEEKGQGGKYLLITILLVVIVLIGGFLFLVANTKDNRLNKDKEVEKVEKEKSKEKQEQKQLRSADTFLKAIASLKYMNVKDFYANEIFSVKNKNGEFDYYNPNTVEKIFTSTDGIVTWYGNFGLVYENNDTKIVDNTGKVLYITDKNIDYYPETKIWIYDDEVYNANGLLEKDATIIDGDGYYLITEKNHELVLENYKLKTIYTYKLENNEKVQSGELNSIYDEQYAVLYTSKRNMIVNVKNGKEVYNSDSEKIAYKSNNIFEIGDNTYYVKNDKLAIKEEGIEKKIEVSYYYFAIDNNVYDANTLKKVDSSTYIPNYETALVEKLTGLEITECRLGYGLKYKGEKLLDCKYDSIDLFDYSITSALISSNKIYVVISKDGHSYELYDIYNNKTSLYNVNDFDISSPFITIYQDDNIYIYNIIDGSKTPNDNGDEVELYYNYYILNSDNKKTYFNKEFKEIISKKIGNDD